MQSEKARIGTPTSPSPSPQPESRPSSVERRNTAGSQQASDVQISSRLEQVEKAGPTSDIELARQKLVDQVKISTDELFQLMTCASEVQEGAEDIVRSKINETMQTLQAVQDASNLPGLSQMIPEDVMGMIDQGRNPDIHTRTFVNRLVSDNQQMRGQAESFDFYRDTLRAKLILAFPDMAKAFDDSDTQSSSHSNIISPNEN